MTEDKVSTKWIWHDYSLVVERSGCHSISACKMAMSGIHHLQAPPTPSLPIPPLTAVAHVEQLPGWAEKLPGWAENLVLHEYHALHRPKKYVAVSGLTAFSYICT